MVTVISPAKDLDLTPIAPMKGATQPEFIKDSARLIEKLRGLNAKQIAKLMDLSPALAELNHQRFQDWRVPFTAKNAKPAVFTFNGDVYRGLNATTMNTDDLKFAQTHVAGRFTRVSATHSRSSGAPGLRLSIPLTPETMRVGSRR